MTCVSQKFYNIFVRHDAAALDAFAKDVKLTNHFGLLEYWARLILSKWWICLNGAQSWNLHF